jgi:CRISPR system Cascade subunit CasC
MSKFLQIHLLTAYSPSNLNRDDLGRPKTAMFGNTQRLRVSSQSLKRVWREAFKPSLDGEHGVRSKRAVIEYFYQPLLQAGVSEKDAFEYSKSLGPHFGKLKVEDEKKAKDKTDAEKLKAHLKNIELETLVFLGNDELASLTALVKTLSSEKRAPKAEELRALRAKPKAADIAMFGRMLADSPEFNVEAAVQVAHAITVHTVEVEDDYFTAVDDLNRADESGSSHIGESGFGAGLFYSYICVDRDLLVENVSGDVALASKAIDGLLRAACTVSPTGKQNSHASRARALYAQAELGDAQPRQLSFAFLKPLDESNQDLAANTIKALEDSQSKMDAVYGKDEKRSQFNAVAGTGSLTELLTFATSNLASKA